MPAFEIDVYDVTNEQFLQFVEAGGYGREELWSPEDWRWIRTTAREHPHFWTRRNGEWRWRGLFGEFPLPPGWPVYVTHAEASAYARFRRRRLPTEAEFHRAAYGSPSRRERVHPWGDESPDRTRGNFGFVRSDPVRVGSFPAGQSAWGVHDLVGNGWEWTSTVFEGFPGFRPMASYPEYSADFFDGQHFVLKGASSGTALELLRRSFRNWFRPQYPYVYATFRLVGLNVRRSIDMRISAAKLEALDELAEDVRRDLALEPKQLQSKYFYDDLGSFLFEAICRLPWYGITRAELGLLSRNADAVLSRFPAPTTVVELGCGSGDKLAIVAEAGAKHGKLHKVQLIDISPTAIEASTRALRRFRQLSIVGHRTTYANGFRRVAERRRNDPAMLVLFLGSNLGNLDPPADLEFLRTIRATLQHGDGLLLGTDLVKPEADLFWPTTTRWE